MSPSSVVPVAPDGLDLVLFFVIYDVRGWPRIILSVFFHLMVRGEKGCMENRVNRPLVRKAETEYYG